jgi:3-dehydroquinate synthase
MIQQVNFPSSSVNFMFESPFDTLWQTYDKQQVVIITNEHIARLYDSLFTGLKVLVIPPGEHSKDMRTVESLARQLLELQATRKMMLIGVGGGVVTDIVGFLASVYMRGVAFGFVPTTLLGMVDAAIGGKNGVNLGMHKNILGTITQPQFILYDPRFLDTLPDDEWSNGFAEIIKYACIFDAPMFDELAKHNISYYQDEDDEALSGLIKRCTDWKIKTVQEDEHETGKRKLLNFGHTAAHAIENLYELPHGKAVAIGMVIACMISEEVGHLDVGVTGQLKTMLSQYHLPVKLKFSGGKAMEILKMDKKRDGDMIDYIILEEKGEAAIKALPFDIIEKALKAYESNN